MGQQQLLLLVLGIVIVGLAVVGGVEAFNHYKGETELDAAIEHGMRIASDAKAYALTPEEAGGGGGKLPRSFDELYPGSELANGSTYEIPQGEIELQPVTSSRIGDDDALAFLFIRTNSGMGETAEKQGNFYKRRGPGISFGKGRQTVYTDQIVRR